MRSSILIIYTGGTIGMKTDAETGALVPFDFSGIYDEFPSLKRLNVDIDVLTMSPVIDSSNVEPSNWAALAATTTPATTASSYCTGPTPCPIPPRR